MLKGITGVSMASAPGGQHVTGPSSHSSTDTIDPVTKFKILVPHLKESLQVNCVACNKLGHFTVEIFNLKLPFDFAWISKNAAF